MPASVGSCLADSHEVSLESLSAILDSSREEDAQRYLATHGEILLAAFGSRWYVNLCIPKFRFGTKHLSDFVLVSGQSFSYEIVLIELEPPTARPFSKAGKYARRLNDALGQVDDWMVWIRENPEYFRRSLAEELRKTAYDRRSRRYAADQLDPDSFEGNFSPYHDGKQWAEFVTAKIIIGRRSMLTEETNRRRALHYENTGKKVEIVPFDRLVEVEEALRRETVR